jgi:chromosome segregation ATPase
MSEIVKNKYLDFEGLKKYDELLKAFIESGHKGLADAIAALDAKLGSLEFEGSDDKSFAEVINEIYSAIADIVEKQGALDEKDVELEGKIKDIIGDLESLEGLTLADIKSKLSEHADAIAQHTTEIDDVKGRVSTLEGTIEDLKNLGGENGLVAIVDKVNSNITAIEKLNGEGEGSVKKAAADAQAAAVSTAAADATSKADAALAAAKTYADGIGDRVAVLEAIDHEQLVADAVAAVVDGAESDFDTLKEVAQWIASDKEGSAALQTTVSGHTDSINTINSDIDALEAKVDEDIANLTTHMAEAATALAEVDGRLDALEAFEETHASIEVSDIEGLFTQA